ncbi:MAG: CRTAC1 family protein [Terracidiphilus sp.]
MTGLLNRRGFLRMGAGAGLASLDAVHLSSLAASAIAAPRLNFVNAVDRSGISFVLHNSWSPRRYQVETMAGGVALFDYNNDGLLDLYFTNGARLPSLDKSDPRFYNRLYRNNGDGTFTDMTVSAGVQGAFFSIGVAAADYDNDGHQDLFVTGANGYQLFHNNGDGTFTDVTEKAGLRKVRPGMAHQFSVAAGWFDYDNDGFLDLIVINYLDWTPATDIVCLDRGLSSYCSPTDYAGTPNLLFHNNRDGTFTDVSERSGIGGHIGKGMGVAFADYDGDGFTDVFVCNDTLRNFLFHNNGDGTFTETGILAGVAYNQNGKSVAAMGVDFRDIDNDGRPDLVVTDMIGDSFLLFHNEGKGFFEDRSLSSRITSGSLKLTGWGMGVYDFDNDGWKDIFTSNAQILDNSEEIDHIPYKLSNSLFRNNHDLTFSDIASTSGEGLLARAPHRGAAFGDLNNDGRIDVVVNCLNSHPELLMNTAVDKSNWLLIELTGTRSNRDGLGTQVTLVSASRVQHNHATTSVGYGSSSDKRVHFGLGSDTRIDRLELTWPSGVKRILSGIAANQILKVREAATARG